LKLSEKDTLRVMELLDNPPKPNAKLFAAAFALPDNA
ncbi:type II toxin -antitoxin system TacA 1-like antitoxin, partial [Proteus mirabilis]